MRLSICIKFKKEIAMSKLLFSFLLTFSLLLSGLLAEPNQKGSTVKKHDKKSHKKHKEFMRFLKELNLTDDQKEIVKELKQRMKEKKQSFKDEMKNLRARMKEIHQSSSLNEDELIEIGGKMGELKVKMRLTHRRFFEDLKPHLDAEQLKTLEAFQAKMKNKLSKRKKGRRHRKGETRGQRE